MRSPATLRKNAAGTVALEFALALPVLLLVILGCFDVAEYLISVDRVRRVASTASNDISQWWSAPTPANGGPVGGQGPLGPSGMLSVLMGAVQVANPLTAGTSNGQFSVIMTFVEGKTVNNATKPVIQGQIQYPASARTISMLTNTVGGSANNTTTAILPAGFTMQLGDQAIFTEVSYTFNPFPLNVLGSLPTNLINLKDYAVFKPRQTIIFNTSY